VARLRPHGRARRDARGARRQAREQAVQSRASSPTRTSTSKQRG
jgi:hypothetical protein